MTFLENNTYILFNPLNELLGINLKEIIQVNNIYQYILYSVIYKSKNVAT